MAVSRYRDVENLLEEIPARSRLFDEEVRAQILREADALYLERYAPVRDAHRQLDLIYQRIAATLRRWFSSCPGWSLPKPGGWSNMKA